MQDTDADLDTIRAAALESYRAGGDGDDTLKRIERLGSLARAGSSQRQLYLHLMIQVIGFRQRRHAEALPYCEQATGEFPQDVDAWFLHGKTLVMLGYLLRALAALKRAWRLKPEARSAIALAGILDTAGRATLAVKLAEVAYDLGFRSDGLHLLLARNLLSLRQPARAREHLQTLEEAGFKSSYADSLKRIADRGIATLEHRRQSSGRPLVRTIAIGGANYVGSTVLGIVLGSLPGVAFGGETQVLTQRWDIAAGKQVDIDFERDDPRTLSHCRVCGGQCNAFTLAFRQHLAQNPEDIYAKIGAHLKEGVVVISDKTVTRLWLADPLIGFDLIVLYKPPGTWVRSMARRQAHRVNSNLLRPEAGGTYAAWLDGWCNTYEQLLRMPVPYNRMAVLDWDRFVGDPEFHVVRLLSKLELPGSSGVLNDLEVDHFIGGNDNVDLEQISRDRAVTFAPSDAPALSFDQEREVSGHKRAQAIARRLERRYLLDFAPRRPD